MLICIELKQNSQQSDSFHKKIKIYVAPSLQWKCPLDTAVGISIVY